MTRIKTVAVSNDIPVEERIKQGDISAFENVFREYYAPLTHYTYGILKDMEAAEEVVQDFFFVYWNNRHEIEIQTSLKSYLYQSVRNKALKIIRHENVKLNYAARFLEAEGSSRSESHPWELNELQALINEVLAHLPERCSRIFCMNRFEGLKYREIAEQLSVSVKTVEANMGKALCEFKKALAQYRV